MSLLKMAGTFGEKDWSGQLKQFQKQGTHPV